MFPAVVETIVIGRREAADLQHGITHNQAWGITGMSAWIGIMISAQTGEAFPLLLPAVTVLMFSGLSKLSSKYRDQDGNGPPGA